jgi:hypothetical protein
MNPLESRKQLLIAESELNRAQWSEDWQTMGHAIRDLAQQAKVMAAWASAAALLVAGVRALWRDPSAPAPTKSTWFQKLLKAARLASTIWLALRARDEKEEHPCCVAGAPPRTSHQ